MLVRAQVAKVLDRVAQEGDAGFDQEHLETPTGAVRPCTTPTYVLRLLNAPCFKAILTVVTFGCLYEADGRAYGGSGASHCPDLPQLHRTGRGITALALWQ